MVKLGMRNLLLGTALFVAFALSAQAVVIDSIDPSTMAFPDHYSLSVNSIQQVASIGVVGLNPNSTLGGRRDVSLAINGGSGAISTKLDADGFLQFDNDDNTSATLMLSYGIGADLNADFSGSNGIAITVSAVNNGANQLGLGSGTFSLSLRSGVTVASSTFNIAFNTPGVYFFAFSDPGFAGLNFADIDAMTLTLDTTTAGSDFRIEDISTVVIPEPSTYLLLGVGLIGLVPLLRRRTVRA